MVSKSSLKKLATVSMAVVLGISLSPSINARAQAQSRPNGVNQNLSNPYQVADVFDPPDRGAPPRTAEGGTRGCEIAKEGQKDLTALTPFPYLALTVEEYPTLFWYVPKSEAVELEFTLLDENEQEIYKTTFATPTQAGIVSLSLPEGELAPLKAGKMYHWYLAMVCDAQDRTGDRWVAGSIERYEPSQSLSEELAEASQMAVPSIYAREGIWQDALSTLAELRRDNPNDLTLLSRWEELLNSVQLGQFAEEPLVDPIKISQE